MGPARATLPQAELVRGLDFTGATARPFRVIWYPLTPVVFVACAAGLLVNSLQSSPVESVAGLVLIAAGLPVYFYYRKGILNVAER
jgi:hypothetical protein